MRYGTFYHLYHIRRRLVADGYTRSSTMLTKQSIGTKLKNWCISVSHLSSSETGTMSMFQLGWDFSRPMWGESELILARISQKLIPTNYAFVFKSTKNSFPPLAPLSNPCFPSLFLCLYYLFANSVLLFQGLWFKSFGWVFCA